ncbi:DUF3857 domain-containing protein [Flavobacterium restrictum]|uniref:DUF3857 domain-containing protein n=1 Tax=Flavobacterium restrictum TaxID=2594428 RepID=A0A553EB25_9FLAO|nr:DUF3857 domain-containing protein [Flavobacterium restrictum]TRX42274.1 DUF3857 domain-containing protein [Flavobacterium restrictum]
MSLNKSVLLLLLLSVCLQSNAQEFKLGKVSIAELQQKQHPKDTTAVAAILFEKGEVHFEFTQDNGFTMVTEVATRIKIYKKEGYDFSNQKVAYYIGGSTKENVSFTDAATYNLVDGKIEKTKLKSDGEFNEKVNRYWGQVKIALPNVKVGSVIEFKYTVKSSRYGSLQDWQFQNSIPVNYSEFKTYIPEYYSYKPSMKGFITPKVTEEKKQKTINYSYREPAEPGSAITTSSSQEKLEFQETKTTYVAENLPALKEEAFVNNINNYASSVSHELSVIKYPNRPYEYYSTDWAAVTKTIYDYDDFGPELNKTGYFEDDLKIVLAGLNTTDEKISALLNYVKNAVKWNDYTGYSCNDGVKKAYKDKTGNVAEINLMLTAMLRYAGLTANPVLVSTRSNGIALFPNRTAFNYVIAAVETPQGVVLLDATDKFAMPNVLPFRALNWVGRLIRKDGTSQEIDLMPKVASMDTIAMNYTVDANGQISGKLREQKTDHEALLFRKNADAVTADMYLEKLENEYKKIEISDYVRANEKELQLPVSETFAFKGANLCEIIGGKIYISPLLFFAKEQNPFKQEVREYPVDFGYPFLEKYAINITIPDGYEVETLPVAAILKMQDDLGAFKFMTNVSGNIIQIAMTHQINTPIISSEYYPMLKDYYQGMLAKQSEKIILKKI